VDLGYVDQQQHHSKNSAYHEDLEETASLNEAKTETRKLVDASFEVSGNFREKVLTHEWMDNSRREMAYCIQHRYKEARVYNCNDGALIENTIPLRPANIPVDTIVKGARKESAVKEIISCFAPADLVEEIPDRLETMGRDLARLAEEINRVLNRPVATREALWDVMADVYAFIDPDLKIRPEASLIHGSIMHLMCMCYEAVTDDEDDARAMEFARICLANISDFLAESQRVFRLEVIDHYMNTRQQGGKP
jgi:hypothetical protein